MINPSTMEGCRPSQHERRARRAWQQERKSKGTKSAGDYAQRLSRRSSAKKLTVSFEATVEGDLEFRNATKRPEPL